jgi:sterol 3beta-glucosyltransferase
MFGILAYPAQGIYKSIKSSRDKTIAEGIRAEKLASYQRYIRTLEDRR